MTIIRLRRGLRPSSGGGGGNGFTPASGDFALTGTIAEGNSLTLTSQAGVFSTKPTAGKPRYLWMPGKGSTTSLHALSRFTSWPVDDAGADGKTNPKYGDITTNVVRTGSTSAYEMRPSRAGGTPNPACVGQIPISSTDLYCCLIHRTNFNGTDLGPLQNDWNLKSHRWWNTGFTHDFKTGFGDADPPDYTNDNMVVYYENTVLDESGNQNVGSSTSSRIPKNRWLVEEIEIHQGDVNVENAVTRVYHDGQLATTYTNCSRSGSLTQLYGLYHLHQFQSVPEPPGDTNRMYYDLWYLDDSFCRLYLTNSATWSTATTGTRVLQIPTSWAAGEIEFTHNLNELASAAGSHLHVMKSDRSTVYAGQFN